MLNIELLVMPDCPNEGLAAELIATAVTDTGVAATVTRTLVATEAEARRLGFIGSPTILIDGLDAFPVPHASVGLACRLYRTPAGPRGVPSLRDLRQALTREAAPWPAP